MSDAIASIDRELLEALEALLAEFDDGEGGGTSLHLATITAERHAEIRALIARRREWDIDW